MLDNYWLVQNLPFLGKVVELHRVSQLQRVLDEADYLGPFQSGWKQPWLPTLGTGWRECIFDGPPGHFKVGFDTIDYVLVGGWPSDSTPSGSTNPDGDSGGLLFDIRGLEFIYV